MPLSTTSVALTGSWAVIAEGVTRCIVQVSSSNGVAIHVGTDDPDASSPEIVLTRDGDRSVALDDLSTEKVWARAAAQRGAAAVTVIKG